MGERGDRERPAARGAEAAKPRGQDRATQDRATQDRATQDRATQDRATQDRATRDRATREDALARALRDNLKRRKAQARLRAGAKPDMAASRDGDSDG